FMAGMGFMKFNEMIGRTEKIIPQKLNNHWKARGLDLSKLLFKPEPLYPTNPFRTREQDHALEHQIDHELIKLAQPALEKGKNVNIKMPVRNTNRTVGAMLSGEVAKRYGDQGLPDRTILIEMIGTAGQSFGTFLAKGIELKLTGESNDYTGKGLSGGKLIIKVPEGITYDPAENIIIGNTCLYGATGGEAYINGLAGERFAVRNSGAYAVVEGVGDHGCEYMTGGVVVVLGKTGRNFAAGMSGGIAYVWDPKNQFMKYINKQMVDVETIINENDFYEVKNLISKHLEYTGSKRAKQILDSWDEEKNSFWKVMPGEYKIALQKLEEEKASETSSELQNRSSEEIESEAANG
ncbi:MAG: glutamate synthase subunit alpha, partial [Ignavibacteria bacterium]